MRGRTRRFEITARQPQERLPVGVTGPSDLQRTEPQRMPSGPSCRLAKAQLQGGSSPGAGMTLSRPSSGSNGPRGTAPAPRTFNYRNTYDIATDVQGASAKDILRFIYYDIGCRSRATLSPTSCAAYARNHAHNIRSFTAALCATHVCILLPGKSASDASFFSSHHTKRTIY